MNFFSLKISKKLFLALFSMLIMGITFVGQSFVIEDPKESDLATQLLALIDAEEPSDLSESALTNIATTIFSEVENMPSPDPSGLISENDFSSGEICFYNTMNPWQIEARMPESIKTLLATMVQMRDNVDADQSGDPSGLNDVISLLYIAYGSYFVQVHHGGCAELPWRDNQPQCFWAIVAPAVKIKSQDLRDKVHSLATYSLGGGVDFGHACYEPAGSVLNWAYSAQALADAGAIIADALIEVGCGFASAAIEVFSVGSASAGVFALEVGCQLLEGAADGGIEMLAAGDTDAWGVWVEEVPASFFNSLNPTINLPDSPIPAKAYKNKNTMLRQKPDGDFTANYLIPGNMLTYMSDEEVIKFKESRSEDQATKDLWTGGFGSQWVER